MDMDPRLLIEKDRLSRDLAMALAWAKFLNSEMDVVAPVWAVRDDDQIIMAVGSDPLIPGSTESALSANAALRELGYRTSATLSMWKHFGMNVYPDDISAHARLQAVAYFKSRGLMPTKRR